MRIIMAKNKQNNRGLNGVKGGYAVRNMIREVQQRMADGTLQVTAKATNEQEAQQLAKTRELNTQSRQSEYF